MTRELGKGDQNTSSRISYSDKSMPIKSAHMVMSPLSSIGVVGVIRLFLVTSESGQSSHIGIILVQNLLSR